MATVKSVLWKTAVTLVALVLIWWYFTTQIDWKTITSERWDIDWTYFWAGTILALTAATLDGLAWWRILVFLDNRIKASDTLVVHWAGFTLGILIPVAGALELVVKSVFLQKRYPGWTSEETISSIAAIRTVFLVTAYGIWGVLILSIGFEGILSPLLTVVALVVVWLLLTVWIAALIYFFGNVDHLARLVEFLGKPMLRYPSLHNAYAKMKAWLERFATTFMYIMKMPRKEKGYMLFLVFVQNMIRWVGVYFIYLAVFDLPFFVVMITSTAGNFVNLVPAGIPALAGLRELVSTEVVKAFGVDPNLSFVGAVVKSLSLWLYFAFSLIVGVPYLLLVKPLRKPRGPRPDLEVHVEDPVVGEEASGPEGDDEGEREEGFGTVGLSGGADNLDEVPNP